MNPYNDINDLDQVINDLERGLQYSKNKSKDTKNLNTIIKTRNSFELMLKNNYFTDVLESMIYDQLFYFYEKHKILEGGDINELEKDIMFHFDNMFTLGSDAKLEVLTDYLRRYIDFVNDVHNNPPKDVKTYIDTQDKLIGEKTKERVTKIKSLIKFKKR